MGFNPFWREFLGLDRMDKPKMIKKKKKKKKKMEYKDTKEYARNKRKRAKLT